MAITTESEAKLGGAAHALPMERSRGLPGRIERPIRITFLGSGSFFSTSLCRDVAQTPGNAGGEIVLVDIDEQRLALSLDAIRKMLGHVGAAGWTVTAATDRRAALTGSQYVVNCIEVSGVECVAADNDIPLKYGVDQCIGDTIGPGGLFKALRTVPVFLEVLRDVEMLCPDALVMNYTNPMSIMCLAAGRASRANVVGLCHSVQGTSRKLARDAEVPYDEMTWQCAGINHLAWFTRLEHRGRDLYPVLREKVRDHAGDVYESDPVRYDMMLHFGAFITESSGHLSEYLPYYRKNPDAMKRYCREGYRGGSRFYADNWPNWRQEQDHQRQRMTAGDFADWNPRRSYEYASWIIEAMEKDTPFRIHGNVMNAPGASATRSYGLPASAGMSSTRVESSGTLITNLPGDGCVEVACMVDRAGIHPTRLGKLPAQMAHLCASNMAMFDLAAAACIERSREAAIHALLLDPLTAAVCTPGQIKAMALEMFTAQSTWLPDYR